MTAQRALATHATRASPRPLLIRAAMTPLLAGTTCSVVGDTGGVMNSVNGLRWDRCEGLARASAYSGSKSCSCGKCIAVRRLTHECEQARAALQSAHHEHAVCCCSSDSPHCVLFPVTRWLLRCGFLPEWRHNCGSTWAPLAPRHSDGCTRCAGRGRPHCGGGLPTASCDC